MLLIYRLKKLKVFVILIFIIKHLKKPNLIIKAVFYSLLKAIRNRLNAAIILNLVNN